MPQITSAYYFNRDVTDTVKDLERIYGTITVSNDKLGVDPAQDTFKLLTVQYSDGTSRVAGEDQKIKLSGASIVSANYGKRDVLHQVQNLYRIASTFMVSNDNLGGDPLPGVVKVLVVGYDDGSTRAATEDQEIRLI